MKVDRDAVTKAFARVREAQEEIEACVESTDGDVDRIFWLLTNRFDPAVEAANKVGIFTGYFEKWADNLYNPHPTLYPMVAQPRAVGWDVVVMEPKAKIAGTRRPKANVVAGTRAVNNLFKAEDVALQHAQERAARHAAHSAPTQGEPLARPQTEEEWAQLEKDERNILSALRRLDQAGVDPIFLNAQVDLVDEKLVGNTPAEKPKYDYVARFYGQDRWRLVKIEGAGQAG